MDELASELVESGKYVLHGDFSHLTVLHKQARDWAGKVWVANSHNDRTHEMRTDALMNAGKHFLSNVACV